MFYDRKEEQKQINAQLKKIAQGKRVAIIIEGKRGVGKTNLMRNCIKKHRGDAFKFASLDYVYKCNEEEFDKEFAFAADVLASLQNQKERAFDKCLIDSLDGISPVSVRESVAKLIPQIPGLSSLQDILEYSLKGIVESKATVSDIMIKKQLVICFSNMISRLLSGQNIILCIDDISWMDSYSFEVLKSVLLRDDNCFISIIVTSRRTVDLEEPFNKRYSELENILCDSYDDRNLLSITLHNFDSDLFTDIVEKHNRLLIQNNNLLLHKITEGNPLEINNLFKSSDEEIEKMISDYKKNTGLEESGYPFTVERNISIFNINIYNAIILSVIAVYGMPISYEILGLCVKDIVEGVHCRKYADDKYVKAIDELEKFELITRENVVWFCHDSSREILMDYIRTNGDFFEVAKNVAASLSKARNDESDYACEILRLYSESAFNEGFQYYKELQKDTKNNLSVIRAASLCFEKCILVLEETDIEDYGINIFLKHMYQGALLDDAARLAQLLMRFEDDLTDNSKYELISIYTKVLIDLGIFSGKNSANEMYNKVKALANINITKKLEIEIIGMTLYEHQGKPEMINNCFNKAKQLVDKYEYPLPILCRFYRDKGLTSFHGELVEDYDKAIELAANTSEGSDRDMLLGTCNNNRGLAAFYNGDIDLARDYFTTAKYYIKKSGYEILRPLNNLACCAIVAEDYESANILLLEALRQPFSGAFETASAKINRSIVLYALGDKSGAERILHSFTNEYMCGERKHDGWIYANSLLNQAFIHYSCGDYEEAARLYKESNFYKSRFRPDVEENRRNSLGIKCLNHTPLSWNNTNKFDFFETPFILSLLAYYII